MTNWAIATACVSRQVYAWPHNVQFGKVHHKNYCTTFSIIYSKTISRIHKMHFSEPKISIFLCGGPPNTCRISNFINFTTPQALSCFNYHRVKIKVIVMHCIALHCIALYCIVLYCSGQFSVSMKCGRVLNSENIKWFDG